MKALSVRQPWAWAIARGHKDVVNRRWATTYRGPLLIHASMRIDLDACGSDLLREVGWSADDPLAVMGAIVAMVSLSGVCNEAVAGGASCCGRWADPGAYHWRLTEPRPLRRPVLALGRLGLWEAEPTLLAELPADLAVH